MKMKDSRSLRLQLKQQRLIDRRDGSGFGNTCWRSILAVQRLLKSALAVANTTTVCCLATALILIYLSEIPSIDVVLILLLSLFCLVFLLVFFRNSVKQTKHVIPVQTVTRACWGIKIKGICSSSSSRLSGQICQIVFVMLHNCIAMCICHRAEVWVLPDSMPLCVVMCTDWTDRLHGLFWLTTLPPPSPHPHTHRHTQHSTPSPLSSQEWGKCFKGHCEGSLCWPLGDHLRFASGRLLKTADGPALQSCC